MTLLEGLTPFRLYWYLAVVRILLISVPQHGYIHPDEYFQSVEVLAGKFLDVESKVPWEFNSTLPIRSMTVPYFTIGMCIKFLRDFHYIFKEFLGVPLVTPYFLVVAPRFFMGILSFTVDYSLYKICANNNEKFKGKLLVLGSSYVMIVYGTRTFSNTIEMVLFSLLLYYVCESLTFSNILTKKREYVNYRYDTSTTPVERAKFHKLRLFLVSDSLRNCLIISTITVIGFFNRPTFLGFAVIPVFFWLYRGIGSKSVTALQFHTRMIIFIICSLPSFLLIILIDSFYYGYLTWGEIGMLDISINNFVFTPWNYVKYNSNSENLALHGLHPKFLHLLVNIPLLFSILGLRGLMTMVEYFKLWTQRKYHLLPSVRSLKCLMTLSIIVPLTLLSIFPHQEPRFLIPLLMPLTYLYSNAISPESDNIVVEAPKSTTKSDVKITKNSNNTMLTFWLTINGIFAVFYGFLHQGGVYKAAIYLERDMKLSDMSTEYHLVTSHIYSIPESLFLQKSTKKLYESKEKKYAVKRRVFLYEEGSNDLGGVLKNIRKIIHRNAISKMHKPKKKFKIYLLLSGSLSGKFNDLINDVNVNSTNDFINFKMVTTFYPHVSTEALPDFTHYCLDLGLASVYKPDCTILPLVDYIVEVFRSLGLKLYQVSPTRITPR